MNQKDIARLYLLIILGIFFLMLGVISLSGCTSTPKKASLPAVNLYSVLDNSETKPSPVVRLIDSTGRFHCSAVVISDSYLATAAHCVSEVDERELSLESSTGVPLKIKAKYVAAATRADYALMTGDFSSINAVRVLYAPKDILSNLGSVVTSCGFPYGGKLFCVRFILTGPEFFKLQGKSFLYPGMSGGPVFNDNGEVIAVNSYVQDSYVVVAPLIEIFANLNVKVSE